MAYKLGFRRGSNGFHFCLKAYNFGLHSLKESLIFYSTSVVSSKDVIKHPLMVDFLVQSVGFSEQEAISIATKVKVSKSLKSTEKSELVIDFLKQSGFDGSQVRKVIARYPKVLRNDVDKTLKPKIRAFKDLGFSGSNLGLIISRHPHMLVRDLESSLVPVIGMLKSLFGSKEQLVSSLLQMRSPRLFYATVYKNLSANLLLMQSYGLTSERIKWLILRSGFPFTGTQWAEQIAKRVEEKLGIPRTSDMFVYGIHALTLKSEENIESWLDLFRSFGWSETDISTLLRKHPLTLGQSEKSLRVKLKYFMEDLGLGSDYLASCPSLLTYSMEKRILPRVAVRQTLMDRNLLKRQISVYSILTMSDSKFIMKYLLPHKEKLPQLYDNYTLAIHRKKKL